METISLTLFSLEFELLHHIFAKALSWSSTRWARIVSLRRPDMFPFHMFMFHSWFSSVKVWTGPAPFLVKLITAKVWPHLDLEPSLVGVKGTNVSMSHLSPGLLSVMRAPVLFSSSPITASGLKNCGNHWDQPPSVVAPGIWRRLLNNSLLCSGETARDWRGRSYKKNKWLKKQVWKMAVIVWPSCWTNSSLTIVFVRLGKTNSKTRALALLFVS